MNYIKINGLSSQYIQGLIIQSLPQITKPLMRSSIEEIDGRDGDIITQLGYSAYDKTFSIGLYGDYDTDRISSYFNASGKVTFSNEPDKYYYFDMLEQIDFERLLRFKTAEIKMHVQPFKYSTVEGTVTKDGASGQMTITNQGNIYSRPTIEITGTGAITLSLNGKSMLTITMGNAKNVTIDMAALEAYNDNGLMNRHIAGDYSEFMLKQGSNVIAWTGNVQSIAINKYSRWV